MDVVQFQEKLREICDLGKQNGNLLTHEQIREHFASTDLETSQMVKVLQYLKLQGITIEGEENAAPGGGSSRGGRSSAQWNQDTSYPGGRSLSERIPVRGKHWEGSKPGNGPYAFENLADGDALAEAALTSIICR